MAGHCECCRSQGASTKLAMGRYTASLCQRCADKHHALNRCLLCGAPAWSCAQLAHVTAEHPSYVLKGSNMPEPEPLAPRFKRLGIL